MSPERRIANEDAYVKQAESATDAPQVQPRARASECSDWIF